MQRDFYGTGEPDWSFRANAFRQLDGTPIIFTRRVRKAARREIAKNVLALLAFWAVGAACLVLAVKVLS